MGSKNATISSINFVGELLVNHRSYEEEDDVDEEEEDEDEDEADDKGEVVE